MQPRSGETWSADARGTYFRAATSKELSANGWPTGTHLVLYPPGDVRRNQELPVVVGPTIEYVSLAAGPTWTGTPYHSLYFDGTQPRTTTPTFYRLNSATGSSTRGHVTTDSLGGLYAWVTLASGSNPAREVLATESNAWIDAIKLPDSTVPAKAEMLVVATPVGGGALPPASDDEVYPAAVDPVPMAMFGTMFWCQQHPTNWKSLIAESSFEARAGFRNDQPGPDDTDTGWDIVLETSWCMFVSADVVDFYEVAEAKWCEWGQRPPSLGSPCEAYTCKDGQGVEYPFTGCYKDARCYKDNAWNAVEYADHHLALPDLMLAMAQSAGTMNVNASATLSCPEDLFIYDPELDPPDPATPNYVCGLAAYPSEPLHPGASATPGRPYLAWPPDFLGSDTCATPFVWSHEFGHNFNYQGHHQNYENAPAQDPECSQYKTLMNDGPAPTGTCKVNWFSEPTVDHLLSTCTPGSCPRSAPYVDQYP